MQHIKKIIPNECMIIADFDMLRGSKSTQIGINAPVVQYKMKQGHECKEF